MAKLVLELNRLKRSNLREPDVDAHVEILQGLCDQHLMGEGMAAKLLPPLLQHCLRPGLVVHSIPAARRFLLSCEGVDLGVQRGAERALGCLAERLAQGVENQKELMHLTLAVTLPSLRRMLKAPTEDVYRTALRVLGHYVRRVAPLAPEAAGDRASFGQSAEALLHRDLLPLLSEVKGDDGGDVFGNLLHLQKHRRGRGLGLILFN